MIDDSRRNLANFRLQQAEECLNAAKTMINSSAKSSANRSYYCIFHSMRAVLALDGFDTKKHSGVISYFRKNYIMTEVFEPSFSDIIGKAFTIRNNSDYIDFYIVSKSEVLLQIDNAKQFLEAVKAYLRPILEESD